ncbi:MAG: hypothetical protein CMF62_01655 [Magnetococcales bacterium]|nr:hypothetical protein [Magnetococcales bacterium]|tara:strand:- start:62354 stop:63601 length:1248 start_codon:yes stop_codon:yes gene_type:complete
MSSVTSGQISSSDEKDFSGEIFNSQYLILYKIGEGSFSSVWLSYNLKNKKFYAIKVQNGDDFESGEIEVDILKKLKKLPANQNKNFQLLVDQFTEIYDDEDHICMVSELMAGSLYDIMKSKDYKKGYPLEFCLKTIKTLLLAMKSLNKLGYIHTDIKPNNILLKGTNLHVSKIINEFKKMINKKNKKKINYEKIVSDLNDKFLSVDSDSSSTSSFSYYSEFSFSEKSDFSERTINNDYDVLSEDIKNGIVKLTDFGTCITNKKRQGSEIQTRYYRSPEIILESPHDDKCDIWSVGCTLYELLTGEILFDPEKSRSLNRDRNHLYMIISQLGLIPNNMIKNGKRSKNFFRVNGTLKGVTSIFKNPLKDKLFKKFQENSISDTMSLKLVQFIIDTLEIDPFKRPTIEKLLDDPLFIA